MSEKVFAFYSKDRFKDLLSLSEEKISFLKAKEMAPALPKGWHELSTLPKELRIEFFYKFWQQTLPYHPRAFEMLSHLFERIEEIHFFLLKEEDSPYFPECVYSLKGNETFFRGGVGLTIEEITSFNAKFGGVLPKDYLAFLHIHNGFNRSSDTGIMKIEDIPRNYEKINQELHHAVVSQVEPGDLIPFYECFGLHSYQCFFKRWHPTSEMGNIHFSSIEKTISSYDDPQATLAFETFSDWLAFYLEIMES